LIDFEVDDSLVNLFDFEHITIHYHNSVLIRPLSLYTKLFCCFLKTQKNMRQQFFSHWQKILDYIYVRYF